MSVKGAAPPNTDFLHPAATIALPRASGATFEVDIAARSSDPLECVNNDVNRTKVLVAFATPPP